MRTATYKKKAAARKPLDLSQATEQQIVAAFAGPGILENPPMLPANMAAAIELNRKFMSAAMGVVEAYQLGGDSRLAPMCAPGTVVPSQTDVLGVAQRIMTVVIANHIVMAQLYGKTRETART